VVRQVITLGGEQISGFACRTTAPFSTHMVTPKVTFDIAFVPLTADTGNWSYAYSIPSAGETHDAAGTYTIAAPDQTGARQLAFSGPDHVVFKGFDGNIPQRYRFDLVPGPVSVCP
jgi:hypothetical protein